MSNDARAAPDGIDPVYRDTSRADLEIQLRQARSDHRDLALDVERRTAERDRLRARVAELETAGDEQIRRVEHVSEQINAQHEFLSEILDDAVHEWRAVRGER